MLMAMLHHFYPLTTKLANYIFTKQHNEVQQEWEKKEVLSLTWPLARPTGIL